MKSFRARNPLPIGIAGLLVLVLAFLLAMNFNRLPLIGGTTYSADFSEAGGLQSGNDVRIAGVKVGTVSDIALDGDHVKVTFRVRDAWVGDQSRAAIKVQTVLGQEYLALDPEGTRDLSSSQPIPLQRTVAPYDVVQAFSGLSETVGQINTQQLAQSFQTLSATFAGTPPDVRGALTGLSALSQTISSRDAQLQQLLQNANGVTQTVAQRDAQVQQLLGDGNLLLEELHDREDSITALLNGTRDLSVQLTGLVNDDSAQLTPALRQLNQVTLLLQRNQDNLSRSIQLFAPFTRLFSNVLGNGRWFDSYICGVLPPSVGPVNPEGCQP
jgi:phospholipid/cholesterol/gamma-HCH transport system substrate-binding protein